MVEENKRQLCVFQEAVRKQEPWLWWAFAGDYAAHCTMANGRFNDRACARQQAEAAGLDFAAIETCMADSSKDEAHPLMEARSPCRVAEPYLPALDEGEASMLYSNPQWTLHGGLLQGRSPTAAEGAKPLFGGEVTLLYLQRPAPRTLLSCGRHA